MKKYLIIIFLLTRVFAINGYLYQYEISDCQDECSQYVIEPEAYEFPNINVIFQDSLINIDLYVNRFVEVDLGQEVTCVECSAVEVLEINLSQDCEFPVDCFQDPCIDAEECEIDTPVECISNFCGGCYADFYDSEGSLVDCASATEECFDFTGLDFGSCEMLLGVGLLNDECDYISGCDSIIDGIDYSDLFFDSTQECEQVCDINNPIDLGDINFDDEINVLDVVLLVSFILGELTNEYEYIAADINEDNLLNVLDVIILIEMILNSTISIQINSGTSYGECFGYCIFELRLDNGDAIYKANGWEQYNNEFPNLILLDNLSQNYWQQLVDLIDFEYFYSLDDVYGCPDCADGGAEFIEIIYDGVSKQVTFNAYTEIDGIQELTLSLRSLREDYWNQINQNQECYIMPEVGPCDGICPTFYYNQINNECEEFITGCCGIEAFDAMQECQSTCE